MEHKLDEYTNSTNETKMLHATPKAISVIRPLVSFVVKSLVLGFILPTLFVDVYPTVAGFRFYLRQFCDELYLAKLLLDFGFRYCLEFRIYFITICVYLRKSVP